MRAYHDRQFRTLVVVEDQHGGLWLVPRSRGGWHRRQRMTLTAEKRSDRLTPDPDVDLEWIGIVEAATGSEG